MPYPEGANCEFESRMGLNSKTLVESVLYEESVIPYMIYDKCNFCTTTVVSQWLFTERVRVMLWVLCEPEAVC